MLCTFDILEDYWISLPVCQAELRGAKGCIISYSGDFYGTKEDALNSFDSQSRHSIPVGNISRKSARELRELLSKGSVNAVMKLDITLDYNGTSSNVVGYIPGKDPERMLLLGGHMDGYFHSYQDDLLGVGIILGIAKAMIESGYQPMHTLVFIAHGSEEYGAVESRYDWCIGSWNSINRIHPDWFGKVTAFFNIDAIRPGTPVFNIASTPEYHGFFKEFMREMSVPETSWPQGSALLGLNGPWSDDYNYAIKGVPGIICGRGPAEWSYQNYHTQFDNYTIFEEEKEIISYTAAHYTKMVCAFDRFILPPFHYKYALEGIADDLAELDEEFLQVPVFQLKSAAKSVTETSERLFQSLMELNRHRPNGDIPFSLLPELTQERGKLMEIYRLIQGDLKKLSPWDDVIFAHETVCSNIASIKKALLQLGENSSADIAETLWEVDLFKIGYQFDKEVYDWLMNCQDNTRTDLFWGTGKIHKFAQLSPLLDSLRKDDTKQICHELKNLLDFEHQLLQDILKKETEILLRINEQMLTVKIHKFL